MMRAPEAFRREGRELSLVLVGGLLATTVGWLVGRSLYTYTAPLVFAVLIVAAAVGLPQVLLWLLVGALPFSFRFFLPNRAELQVPSEPVVAALVGAYLLDRLVVAARGERIAAYPLRWPLYAFALSILASLPFTAFPYESGKGALRALAFVLLPLPAYSLLSRRGVFSSTVGVATAAGVVAALVQSVWMVWRGENLAHTTAYLGTLFTNYAIYGFYLTVFLLPLLAQVLFNPRYDRGWVGLGLVLFGGAMLLCWSRGAWLSLLIALGFLLLLRSEAGRWRKWAFMGTAAVLICLALLIGPVRETIASRLETVFDPEYASNKTRLLRWGYALLMFAEHPLFGAGYGSFALSYPNEPFLGANRFYQMGAHNEHLQILAETGLFGALSWLWLNGALFLYGLRLLRRLEAQPTWYGWVAGLLAVQVASLAHLVVESFSATDLFNVPFWLLFAAVPAAEQLALKEGEDCAS
ncbi:MAG: hypothetical protein KatS3mg115_0012 [Candidatus Poribacteria bacterium]|nr:MAG: hypothetical protein KatS3mg115_0012 [Candidatus Poribacteria bacterium]